MIEFIIASLAAWRISYLLINEKGFLNISHRFRQLVARSEYTSELGHCIFCLSVWVSAFISLYFALFLDYPYEYAPVLAMGIAGAVLIVDHTFNLIVQVRNTRATEQLVLNHKIRSEIIAKGIESKEG